MRKISKFLVAGFLLLSGAYGISNFASNEVKEVEAANTDNSKEKWSAIGTINGTSWNTDFALTYDATDDRYELEIALTKGNEFKIRLNNAWTTSIGYGGNTGAGISTYLSNSGGNFKVNTTGNYVLWVKDDNVRNYGDKSYGFGIDKAAEAKYYTVTYNNYDGTTKTESVLENSNYSPVFYEREGYALEGWYTNSSLTTKFVSNSKITANVSLYPKYVEVEDYTVYFEDNSNTFGSAVYAYLYSETFSNHHNAEWPGEKITKDAFGRYVVNVDASKSYDMVVFNNGGTTDETKLQTVDIRLSDCEHEGTFVLGSTKDASGHYNVTVKAAPAKPELSIAVTPVENSGIKFYAGFPAEDADEIKNNNVGFKFVFSGTGVTTKTGYYVCNTTTQTITNIVDGEPVTLNAADNGYAFYFGVIIENIPTGYTSVEVTPAYQHTNGTTIYLTAKTLNFTVANAVVNF